MVRKSLKADDVPIGSAVAVRRSSEDCYDAAGYGTAFYIANVKSVHVDTGDQSVKSIIGHYLLPFSGKRGAACNDETKSWRPGCCRLHQWDELCEKRKACIDCRLPTATTSWLQVELQPEMIFETKLGFTPTNKLNVATKRRIAESAPSPGAWNARLGLPPAGQQPAKKPRSGQSR